VSFKVGDYVRRSTNRDWRVMEIVKFKGKTGFYGKFIDQGDLYPPTYRGFKLDYRIATDEEIARNIARRLSR
jgi:hypothetical protein